MASVAAAVHDAVKRERSANGGRRVEVAALTHGERVLTVEQNKRFEQLGGLKAINMADGGTVGSGSFAQSIANSQSSNNTVNISVPVNVQGGGGSGGLDERQIRVLLEAKMQQFAVEQSRPGGVFYGKGR